MGTRKLWGGRVGWRHIAGALGLGVVALVCYSLYVALHEPDTQDTVVLGQSALYADSPAGIRVLVRDHATGRPVEGARVRIGLEGTGQAEELGEFRTDETGTFSGSVQLPPASPGSYRLLVRTASGVGKDAVSLPVEVRRPCRLYLTTDKPVYQPGQTLHVRAMALNRMTLRPLAGEAVTFEAEDPKGNNVFKAERTASAYGIASADFDIAPEVNLGRYRVRCLAGGVASEKTVAVERYVLPKFKVAVGTDRPYHLPAETLRGEVRASYFFGKPVAAAEVQVVGRTIHAEPVEVFRRTGRTDSEGAYGFRVALPDYFAGVPLAGGDAYLEIEATVTDSAGHVETAFDHSVVTEQAIKVSVLPEGRDVVPGVENRLYILTAYADGRPAACRLDVEGQELETDESGLAVFAPVPRGASLTVNVRATDTAGNVGTLTRTFESGGRAEQFVLRTDKAVYEGGETIQATVISSVPRGTFFLDVIKGGQTVLTKTLEVEGGRGVLDLDLPPGLFGTLKLSAYRITAEGESRANWRVVHIHQARALRIAATSDKPVYRPGETAELSFEVTDGQGSPAPAALGLAAVDEAVFHVTENRPGLLAQFFMADEELLRPAYQIKFAVSPEKLLSGRDQTLALALFSAASQPARKAVTLADLENQGYLDRWELERIREQLQAGTYDRWLEEPEYAKVAQVLKEQEDYSLRTTTYDAKKARADAYRQRYFRTLGAVLTAILVASVPLALIAALSYTVYRFVRTREGEGLDPALPPVRRALRGMALSSVTLLLLPVISCVLLAGRPEPRSSLLLGWLEDLVASALLAANTVVPVVFLLMQVRWCRALMKVEGGAPLGRRLLLVPVVLALGYLGTAAATVAAFLGAWDDGFAALAMLACWILVLWAALSCVALTAKASARHRVAPSDAPSLAPIVMLLVLAALLSLMCMPALSRARKEAQLFSAGSDLHNLNIALSMAGAARLGGEAAGAGPPAPRVREDFPETLLWQPELITDDHGRATLSVPLADSITNWKTNVEAVSADGMLGGTEMNIMAFQDFFVDVDLPTSLTQNDEVSIPVACYNYLKEPQSVELALETADWCAVQGRPVRVVSLDPQEVRSVLFRIKALDVGPHEMTVMARGRKLSDAVRRRIEVRPDGTEVEKLHSGTLAEAVEHTFVIPPEAIPGSHSLLLKVYPSTFSEVVEGLEGIFQKPFGCFEQTSSCTYPNALALLYMKRTGQATPEVEVKARAFINAGYQRLLTFEVPGGGFEWFGNRPANVVLTAYGILEFTDMAEVHDVDPRVAERAARWLLGRQGGDGSWSEGRSGWTWPDVSNELVTTAYVAWALAESRAGGEGLTPALPYLRGHVLSTGHVYTLALAANALLMAERNDPVGRELVERLCSAFVVQGDCAHVGSAGASVVGSTGRCLDVETTALAALAVMKSGQHPEIVKKALTWLSRQRDASGTWGSTQATILAMKALLSGSGKPLGGEQSSDIAVAVNGRPAGEIRITPQTADVLHMLRLTDHLTPGENSIAITQKAAVELPYQLVGRYWLPWKEPVVEAPRPLEIQVEYDAVRLSVDDVLTCTVHVRSNQKAPVTMTIVDLGIPPGFTVDTAAFEGLVKRGVLAKYEMTGRQCILYVCNIRPEAPLRFSYELRARYPIRAKVPPARVYDYYNPEKADVAPPREIVVEGA
jgi:hypothetical protein